MIKSIILDDEKHGIETLQWLIKNNLSDVNVLETFTSPIDAIAYLKNNTVDLIFLDIEMPEMNGFEFLKQLNSTNFDIIFTTAYDEFAVNAFKVSAIDYLLKPIGKKDISLAVEKVKKNKKSNITTNQLEILFNNINKTTNTTERIALPTQEGLFFIKIKEIIYCISDSNYTTIFLDNDKKILVCKTIKIITELLPNHLFIRIHNSHLININKIIKYVRGDGGYVVMEDKKSLSVSRSRKDILLKTVLSSKGSKI